MFSVISSASEACGALKTARIAAMRCGSIGSRNVRGDRLTDTVSGGWIGCRAPFANRRLEHDRRQRVDQPVCSAMWMKLPGSTASMLGVLPAHERLDADDQARPQVQDRLVFEIELILVEALAQLGDERQAAVRIRSRFCA
jgi:hypothetical protein